MRGGQVIVGKKQLTDHWQRLWNAINCLIVIN